MSDRYQQLVNTPIGKVVSKQIGLPSPVMLDATSGGQPVIQRPRPARGRGRGQFKARRCGRERARGDRRRCPHARWPNPRQLRPPTPASRRGCSTPTPRPRTRRSRRSYSMPAGSRTASSCATVWVFFGPRSARCAGPAGWSCSGRRPSRDKTLGRMDEDVWEMVLEVNLTAQERIDEELLEREVIREMGGSCACPR